jgi:hypothetical protein
VDIIEGDKEAARKDYLGDVRRKGRKEEVEGRGVTRHE